MPVTASSAQAPRATCAKPRAVAGESLKLPETYARIPARTLCGAIREPDQSRPRVRRRLLDAGSEAASDGASAHKGPSFVHASPARSTAERNAVGESAPAVVEESHAVTDASRRWRLIAMRRACMVMSCTMCGTLSAAGCCNWRLGSGSSRCGGTLRGGYKQSRINHCGSSRGACALRPSIALA